MADFPTYDLTLLLDTATADEQRDKVLDEVKRILAANDAEVVATQDWGVRKTAFEIRHKGDAEYHLVQFKGGPQVPEALGRYLRITDGVTRFRVIKLHPGTPAAPDLRTHTDSPEPVAAGDRDRGDRDRD